MVGPLRQDPLPHPKKQRYPSISEAAPLQAPKSEKPREAPMSLKGFAENILENAKEVASGTVDAFTISAKSLAYIIENARYLDDVAKSPEFLGQELKNTGKALGHAIFDKYGKYGVRALYEKPIDVVGDVMTVLSLGGGAIAKGGQLANMPKVTAAGKAVSGVPGKLGQMVADLPLRAVGINPKTRKLLTTYEREERAIGEITKKKLGDILDEKFKGFTDREKALLDRAAVEGATAAELAANPRVKDALDAYSGIVREIREKQLGEAGRKLLSQADMDAAVIKKLANRKGIPVEEAAKLYEDLEVKPIYTPAIAEGKQVGIFDLIWGPDDIRLGKVGFLEPFKGGKFSQDPVAYMKKAVNDFVDTETRLRFMDRVIQDPRLTRAALKGEAALGKVVPEGIYKRYFDDNSRAEAIGARDTRLKHGIEKAEQLLTSDPVTQKYVKSIAAVGATDPTVANYLRWTFTRASGRLGAFLRIYDKLLGMFKVSATTLNPRYYTGNIVGDGILSVMAGEVGLHWGVARRLLDSLPPELRAGARAALSENPVLAKFQNLAQIAQAADDLARAGIWTKETAKVFKEAGASFASAEQTFEEFARTVGRSVEDLSNLQVQSQILDQDIARSSKELYAATERVNHLERLEVKLANALSKAKRSGADTTSLRKRYTRIGNEYLDAREAKEAILGRAREQFVKSGEYHRRIPEAAKYAEVARQATDRANAFLGDYLNLGPIERAIFRRVVPFYSFSKAMTKLAFTYPFIAPKTSFFWHRYAQAQADMATDPAIPDYMAGYFPVGGYENGDSLWIRLSQLGPFGGLRQGRGGDLPIPGILQFWSQNPAIRLGYRMVGGRDEFYWAGRPQAGQVWVSAGDGTINRFREDGKLENVVPQMSPADALSILFPPAQIIEQLISGYDVSKGDVRTAKGDPKYPMTPGMTALKLLGVSSKQGSAADFRRAERIRVVKTFQDLKNALPRMDPEQKEAALQYFRDFSKGYYRNFKAK